MGACRNSFFGVFLLFLAKFTLQSSFFSESRLFTRPLFCFLFQIWIGGQPTDPDFFRDPDFSFVLFQIFMYSSVGSILWEATVGKLAAGEVDGQG
jgi:hypothetical protein